MKEGNIGALRGLPLPCFDVWSAYRKSSVKPPLAPLIILH